MFFKNKKNSNNFYINFHISKNGLISIFKKNNNNIWAFASYALKEELTMEVMKTQFKLFFKKLKAILLNYVYLFELKFCLNMSPFWIDVFKQ